MPFSKPRWYLARAGSGKAFSPRRRTSSITTTSSSVFSPLSQCSTLLSGHATATATDSSVSTPSELIGPVYGNPGDYGGADAHDDHDFSPDYSPHRRTPYPTGVVAETPVWIRPTFFHSRQGGGAAAKSTAVDRPVLDLGPRHRKRKSWYLCITGVSPAEPAVFLSDRYQKDRQCALADHAKRLDALLRIVEMRSGSGLLERELDERFDPDAAFADVERQAGSKPVLSTASAAMKRQRPVAVNGQKRHWTYLVRSPAPPRVERGDWLARCKAKLSPRHKGRRIREAFMGAAARLLGPV